MDFTREPIIDTVITPKEGCKLVVRSSKSAGQEEYFVDALEVVSFGHSLFYRSTERPKSFLVPATDYEVLEVREARLVLKNVGLDRSIKIGGGAKPPKEPARQEKAVIPEKEDIAVEEDNSAESRAEAKVDRKRERRRHQRRRRGGREEGAKEEGAEGTIVDSEEEKEGTEFSNTDMPQPPVAPTSITSSLLPPPPTLISETIGRYKENALFKGAFFTKETVETQDATKEKEMESTCLPQEEVAVVTSETSVVEIVQPEFGSFEMTEAEEEEIYLQRLKHSSHEEKIDGIPGTTNPDAAESEVSKENQPG